MEGTPANGTLGKAAEKDDDTGGDRNYFRWTGQMDNELAIILRGERKLVTQSDGRLKRSSYNSAANILSIRCARKITALNVKHRLKSWKKYYRIVSDILSQSGFKWDSSKMMVTVDHESIWTNCIKNIKGTSQFRGKTIPNWDNIVDFFTKEEAAWGGVTVTPFGGKEDMVVENVNNDNNNNDDCSRNDQFCSLTPVTEYANHSDSTSTSTRHNKRKSPPSSTMSSPKKTARSYMNMEDAITNLANSVAFYFSSKPKEVDIDELYDAVSAIPELCDDVFFRACNWLMEDEKKFRFLKRLPGDKRKKYIIKCMPSR